MLPLPLLFSVYRATNTHSKHICKLSTFHVRSLPDCKNALRGREAVGRGHTGS